MTSPHPQAISFQLFRRVRGFTLVEVMVSLLIFAFLYLSIGSLYLQNLRMEDLTRCRMHANRVAFSILEQIRSREYNLMNQFAAAAANPNINQGAFLRVIFPDTQAADYTAGGLPAPDIAANPSIYGPAVIPLGCAYYDLRVNMANGAQRFQNQTPAVTVTGMNQGVPAATTAGVVMEYNDDGTVRTRMPMQFWLTLNQNTAVSTVANAGVGQAVEVILAYSWQVRGAWYSGSVRTVIVNLNQI